MSLYTKVKNTARRFFDKSLDFRVMLFNILATGGVAISVATLVLNLVTGMLTGAVLSGLLAVLSVTLLVFTYRTRKYKIAYILTIVTIFMVVFPILFFASGAYKGGMPSMFIFAVLFTVLMHRGENFDTSFTSFKIDSDEYVFGTEYGFFGSETSDVVTEATPDGNCIRSTWSIGDICAEQKIYLVNNDASEQLGTAMLSYTVKNNGSSAKNIKSRILIDNQLGTKDYGYYEVPKQNLGQGYEYFEFERTWDSYADPSIRMPSDYFVRDNPYSSDIVGFGVNSVLWSKNHIR